MKRRVGREVRAPNLNKGKRRTCWTTGGGMVKRPNCLPLPLPLLFATDTLKIFGQGTSPQITGQRITTAMGAGGKGRQNHWSFSATAVMRRFPKVPSAWNARCARTSSACATPATMRERYGIQIDGNLAFGSAKRYYSVKTATLCEEKRCIQPAASSLI